MMSKTKEICAIAAAGVTGMMIGVVVGCLKERLMQTKCIIEEL